MSRGTREAMMRGAAVGMLLFFLMGWAGPVGAAQERSIEQLPKDVWDLAFVWTEPLKQAAKHSSELDPVSGLWIGLLEGSVKSVERTAQLLLAPQRDSSAPPEEPGKIFRYSF